MGEHGLAVEGWIVLSGRERLLGYVKGCSHPLPYYFVAPRKPYWYSLRETRCLLGLKAPVADIAKHRVVSPFEAKNYFEDKCRSNSGVRAGWCRKALGFLEALESSVGEVGVTGSAPLDPRRAGDLDLVVYGSKRGARAYRVLVEMRMEGETLAFRGSGKQWSIEDTVLHQALSSRRVLQGYYRGVVEYTVRIVSCTKPSPCTPRRMVGEKTVRGVIVDSRLSYYTPALYLLRLASSRQPHIFLLTHRIRYQELPVGLYVEVRGLLEETCGTVTTITPDHRGYIKIIARE